MKIWKVILATLVIFGAGVVTGGLLVNHVDRIHLKPKTAKSLSSQTTNPWQQRSKDLLHRMDRELTLTAEQREHIEKIIANSQERTKSLWKPIEPEMRKEMQKVRGEIREQLTPEQLKKFDDLSKPRSPKKPDGHHSGTNAPAAEVLTNAPLTNP